MFRCVGVLVCNYMHFVRVLFHICSQTIHGKFSLLFVSNKLEWREVVVVVDVDVDMSRARARIVKFHFLPSVQMKRDIRSHFLVLLSSKRLAFSHFEELDKLYKTYDRINFGNKQFYHISFLSIHGPTCKVAAVRHRKQRRKKKYKKNLKILHSIRACRCVVFAIKILCSRSKWCINHQVFMVR